MATNVSDRSVAEVIHELGAVFATFDHRTQDSGNISFGIETPDGTRLFAKTAGRNEASTGGTSFEERITALRRASEVHHDVDHPCLVRLVHIVEATDGIVVVYEWFNGDLLRSPAERRNDPGEAGTRFRHLPPNEIAAALDQIIDLHVHLDAAGWVSGDVYDGCIMYDFALHAVRFMDFECYRRGTYVNDVGRLPGSDRFMAPEEYVKGASIDARTTIFNLAKLVAWLLSEYEPSMELYDVVQRATATHPGDRHRTLVEFQHDWRSATNQ